MFLFVPSRTFQTNVEADHRLLSATQCPSSVPQITVRSTGHLNQIFMLLFIHRLWALMSGVDLNCGPGGSLTRLHVRVTVFWVKEMAQ